jgi:hypothetical protein
MICSAAEMALFGTKWRGLGRRLSQKAKSENDLGQMKKWAGTPMPLAPRKESRPLALWGSMRSWNFHGNPAVRHDSKGTHSTQSLYTDIRRFTDFLNAPIRIVEKMVVTFCLAWTLAILQKIRKAKYEYAKTSSQEGPCRPGHRSNTSDEKAKIDDSEESDRQSRRLQADSI